MTVSVNPDFPRNAGWNRRSPWVCSPTAAGFPLTVQAFEGNKAETATMLPVINAFKAAHHLSDVTVVADAGMISKANQIALASRRALVHLGNPYSAAARSGAPNGATHIPDQGIPDGL